MSNAAHYLGARLTISTKIVVDVNELGDTDAFGRPYHVAKSHSTRHVKSMYDTQFSNQPRMLKVSNPFLHDLEEARIHQTPRSLHPSLIPSLFRLG